MSRGLVNKSTGERIPSAPGYIIDKVGDLSALHTTAKDKAVSAINEVTDALADKADTDMVAADFNAGTSYTAGNYCVQDGKLYRFKNNHSGAWSASDVEEVKIAGELSSIKSGLNNVETYSTTAVKIGKWIDGKDIYRKVVSIGNLPDTSQIKVDSGITNIGTVVKLYGVAQSQWVTIPLPYVDSNASSNTSLAFDFNGNKVTVTTTDNKSSLVGYAIIEYTLSS